MKTDINELITLGYEVEGLLLLAMHRGDETPMQVWHMIDSHLQNMRRGIAMQLDLSVDTAADECSSIPVEEMVDNTNQIVADETESLIVTENVSPNVGDVSFSSGTTPEEVSVVCENITDSDEVSDINEDESEITIDGDEPSAVDISEELEPELTIDEKLARENSRNLRKAFSLNDRFRFRRELFGNSDAAFTDTLDLVEAMRSVDEAREYFFEELEWDPDSDEVKDFMDIITKHFLAR